MNQERLYGLGQSESPPEKLNKVTFFNNPRAFEMWMKPPPSRRPSCHASHTVACLVLMLGHLPGREEMLAVLEIQADFGDRLLMTQQVNVI